MNEPKGSKPFDLEAALRGEPVITRDGRKVLHIRKREDWEHNGDWPILAKVDGAKNAESLTASGTWCLSIIPENKNDLFMAPKKVKHQVWLNLYPNGDAVAHRKKEIADANSLSDRIECRLIEWESYE